jgi:3-oxoacyl-[acyl-carrier protein] reductase
LKSLLEGRVAVVTGGSRGIGLAAANVLAAQGASVAICSRADMPSLEQVVRGLPSSGSNEHMASTADVADSAQVAAFYRKVFDRYRRLDVLVNNAGVLGDAVVGMIADDLIDNTLATNVKGAIYNLQAAARLMQRKKTGSIINLSSIIGTRGNRGQTVYGASKAAIIGLTQSAAKDLAPANIRVNAIAPGYIDTPMIAHLDPATHATRVANIGLGRVGKAEEVANAILFLASDLSSYVTGQVLGVDGGMVI